MIKKRLFIRNDDVYKLDERFKGFFEFCLSAEIPVIYGIIPQKTTGELARFLNKMKTKSPHLIDIVQHGWRHVNYNRGNFRNKYEFGPRRRYEQQKRDVLNGYQKMEKVFKNNFTRAFVPPFHGFDENTLRVIREVGFPIFSAGETSDLTGGKTVNLQAKVSLNRYGRTGTPLIPDIRLLMKKVVAQIYSNEPFIGMVFHHGAIASKRKFDKVKILFMGIKRKAREQNASIILFSDILRHRK